MLECIGFDGGPWRVVMQLVRLCQWYTPCLKASPNGVRDKGRTAVLFVNIPSDNTFEELTHGNVAIVRAV